MKTYFPVVPKRKPDPGRLNSSESCPYCRMSFMDFADILGGGVVLGCYNCGGIFMSKECREHDKALKGEQLVEQGGKVVAVFPWLVEALNSSFLSNSDKDGSSLDALGGELTAHEPGTEEKDTDVPQIAMCGKEIPVGKSLEAHERSCKACRAKKAEG